MTPVGQFHVGYPGRWICRNTLDRGANEIPERTHLVRPTAWAKKAQLGGDRSRPTDLLQVSVKAVGLQPPWLAMLKYSVAMADCVLPLCSTQLLAVEGPGN